MTCRRRKLLELLCGVIALAVLILSSECRADGVIFHLRNGDRVAGTLLSETTNQVTLSTVWAKALVIPVDQIERREVFSNTAATNALAAPTGLVAKTNAPPAATNTVIAAKPPSPVVTAPSPPPPNLPWYKHWKGEILAGTSLVRGASDTELYYAKATVTYSHAYLSDPKEFFRNIFGYVVDYGKTDGVISANDMSGSSKTDFDVNQRMYIYNLGAAGYDEIRKIDLHYEDGPGAGYRLFRGTNFLVNTELGVNYQVDERSDETVTRSFYYRIAEDLTWKLNKQMTLTEKYEFFPRADLRQYRMRFESTLSYALMLNLSFNLAVVDFYDTAPAAGVPNNDFEFRTSLGVKF
jgi:hypothetical protein